jgi:hypothetical protein
MGAQARSNARYRPIVEVSPGRGEAERWSRGGQSERPKKETKRRGKRSTVGCEVRCISKVCEDGECDDDIDVEARRIPRNKSSRQSGSALDWSVGKSP